METKRLAMIIHYVLVALLPILSSVNLTIVKNILDNQRTLTYTTSMGTLVLFLGSIILNGWLVGWLCLFPPRYRGEKSYKLLLLVCIGIMLILIADLYVIHLFTGLFILRFPLLQLFNVLPVAVGVYGYLLFAAMRFKEE